MEMKVLVVLLSMLMISAQGSSVSNWVSRSQKISSDTTDHNDAVYISSTIVGDSRLLVSFRGEGVLKVVYCLDLFCHSHRIITVDSTVGQPLMQGSFGGAAWTSIVHHWDASSPIKAWISYIIAGSELRLASCLSFECDQHVIVPAVYSPASDRQLLGTSIAVLGNGHPAFLTHEQTDVSGRLFYFYCSSPACTPASSQVVRQQIAFGSDFPGTSMSSRSLAVDSRGFGIFGMLTTDVSSGGSPRTVTVVFCNSYECSAGQRTKHVVEQSASRPAVVGLFLSLLLGSDGHPFLSYAGFINSRYHLRTVRCNSATHCDSYTHSIHCEPASDPCQAVTVHGEAASMSLRGPTPIIGVMNRYSTAGGALQAIVCADAGCTANHPGNQLLTLRADTKAAFTSCVSDEEAAPSCVYLDVTDPTLPMWISTRGDLTKVPTCEAQGRAHNGCRDLFEKCDVSDTSVGAEGTCKCDALFNGVPSVAGLTPNGCCGHCAEADGKTCDASGACVCSPNYLPGNLTVGLTPYVPQPSGAFLRCSVHCVSQGRDFQHCTGPHEWCDVDNKHTSEFGTCQCRAGAVMSIGGITKGGCCGNCASADNKRCSVLGHCECRPGFRPNAGYVAAVDGSLLTCTVDGMGTTEVPPAPPTPVPFGTLQPTMTPEPTRATEATCCCRTVAPQDGENCITVPVSICTGLYECEAPPTSAPTTPSPTLGFPCCCITKNPLPRENCLPNIPPELCTGDFECIRQPDTLFTPLPAATTTVAPTPALTTAPPFIGGLGGGAIAAIVLVLLAAAAILTICILLCLRRKQTTRNTSLTTSIAAEPFDASGGDYRRPSDALGGGDDAPASSWLESEGEDGDIYQYM